MLITVTTDFSNDHIALDVGEMELSAIKAILEDEIKVDVKDQRIFSNGKELTDDSKTLKQLGVTDNSLLQVRRAPPPPLFPAPRRAVLTQPQNAALHQKIDSFMKTTRLNQNYALAMENTPEAFARVSMLYINLEVNNTPVKAFVDSGAQATILSPGCAARCGLTDLIDDRFAGTAKGVGTAAIQGRIHAAQIKIADLYLQASFTIIENQNLDMLLGLDMLRRFQACIDLEANVLRINGRQVPFLAEHEIPPDPNLPTLQYDTSNLPPSFPDSGGRTLGAAPGSAPPNIPASASSAASSANDEKLARLEALGIPAELTRNLLQAADGNVDVAASLFFSGAP